MENSLVAVLEVGSTGIRLIVAQMRGDGQWKTLDSAARPVALGRDVFNSGELSRESLLECLSVLKNFRELLSGWGMAPEDARGIATSALRAARNRDIFVDRVWQETGFRLSVVDGLEENRLMYLGVRFALGQDLPLFWRANSMILEMGGGSTEVMLLRQGRMAAAHSIKMGTIQIDRRMRMRSSPGLLNERYLREAVRDTIGLLNAEMDMKSVRTMVMAGADARMVAAQAGKRLNEHCFLVEREDFVAFAEEARGYVPGDCMRKLGMAYADAEGFVPGIMALKLFLEETDATQAVIPLVSIREGCLIDIALGLDEAMQEEFHSQIVASAVSMTEKFNCDQAHSTHVAALSVALFDALANEHGMKRRQRVMLEVAAILHDIGTFIKTSGHNRHGYYIVANSEIFGLTRDELDVIACVVRYHRGDPPAESDPEYASLPSERRVLVLKMAALLRVADALDRGHSQKIKSLAVERHASTVSLRCEGVHDIALELVSVEEKADLFQDVFGCSLALS